MAAESIYYWSVPNASFPGSSSIQGVHYDTPSKACSAIVSAYNQPGGWYATSGHISMISVSSYRCNLELKYSGTGSTTTTYISISREGSQCPQGSTYNASTGVCDAPQLQDGEWCDLAGDGSKTGITSNGQCVSELDADLEDQCKAYSKTNGQKTYKVWKYPTSNDADMRNPQKIQDKIGCEVQLLEDVSCKTYPTTVVAPSLLPDGSMSEPYTQPKTAKCTTKGVLTGNISANPESNPADTKCDDQDECAIEPPATTSENQPCTYATDSEGRQSCVYWDYKGKEGAEQCGTVNGQFVCKGDLPQAVGNGIAIGTTVKTEPLEDGKTKVTKTDVAQKTVCIGSGACTTTTTTSKTTIVKNADGSTQSQTGTCTGPQCASSGNPDSNGDGLGDCTGDDCGTEESGEPGSLDAPDLDEVPGFGESMTTFMSSISDAPIMTSVSSISFPQGGTCPRGGAAVPWGTINFDIVCDMSPSILNPLYYVFLAMWAFAAIKLYFTA